MRRRWHNSVKTHEGEVAANLMRRRCWNSCMRQVGCKSGSHKQAKDAVVMDLTHRSTYKITASDLILTPYTKENRKTTHSINLIRKKSKVIIHGVFSFFL